MLEFWQKIDLGSVIKFFGGKPKKQPCLRGLMKSDAAVLLNLLDCLGHDGSVVLIVRSADFVEDFSTYTQIRN